MKCLNFAADTTLDSYNIIRYRRTRHKAGTSKLQPNKFNSEGRGNSQLCFVIMTCPSLMTNTAHKGYSSATSIFKIKSTY